MSIEIKRSKKEAKEWLLECREYDSDDESEYREQMLEYEEDSFKMAKKTAYSTIERWKMPRDSMACVVVPFKRQVCESNLDQEKLDQIKDVLLEFCEKRSAISMEQVECSKCKSIFKGKDMENAFFSTHCLACRFPSVEGSNRFNSDETEEITILKKIMEDLRKRRKEGVHFPWSSHTTYDDSYVTTFSEDSWQKTSTKTKVEKVIYTALKKIFALVRNSTKKTQKTETHYLCMYDSN